MAKLCPKCQKPWNGSKCASCGFCGFCSQARKNLVQGIKNRDREKVINTVVESIKHISGKKVVTIKPIEEGDNASNRRKS